MSGSSEPHEGYPPGTCCASFENLADTYNCPCEVDGACRLTINRTMGFDLWSSLLLVSINRNTKGTYVIHWKTIAFQEPVQCTNLIDKARFQLVLATRGSFVAFTFAEMP